MPRYPSSSYAALSTWFCRQRRCGKKMGEKKGELEIDRHPPHTPPLSLSLSFSVSLSLTHSLSLTLYPLMTHAHILKHVRRLARYRMPVHTVFLCVYILSEGACVWAQACVLLVTRVFCVRVRLRVCVGWWVHVWPNQLLRAMMTMDGVAIATLKSRPCTVIQLLLTPCKSRVCLCPCPCPCLAVCV